MQFPLAVAPTGAATEADFLAVGASSAQFANVTLAAGQYAIYVANTASWIQQGSNPTATTAAGSLFVPAGVPVFLDGRFGAKVATIQDTAAGKASLIRALV